MAGHQDPNPFDGVIDWIEMLRKNGVQILLISNNGEERVRKFAKLLNLDYISKGNKPFKKNIIKGCKTLKIPHENICIVGDQIFTDILGGNISKIKTFLVTDIYNEFEDSIIYKIKRRIERYIINKHYKKKEDNI